MGIPGGSDSRESACNAGDAGSIPGSGGPLEEGMATHSNIFAWRIPWTEEPGGLQSLGWQWVRHDWRINTSALLTLTFSKYWKLELWLWCSTVVSKKGTESLNLRVLEAALNLSIGFGRESIIFFFFFGHTACGILVPHPGTEHMPPALGAPRLNHWITREILGRALFF